MQKLIDLGFKQAATITQDGLGGIQINVTQLANATNILYAFITRQNKDDVDHWRVLYIGHSRKTFANRMSGYQYGNGARTNNRVHNAVRDHLNTEGNQVEVHVLLTGWQLVFKACLWICPPAWSMPLFRGIAITTQRTSTLGYSIRPATLRTG